MTDQEPNASRSVNDDSIRRLEMEVERINQAIKIGPSTRKKLFSVRTSVKLEPFRRSIIERAIKGRSQIFNNEHKIAYKTSTPMPKCTNRKANRSNNTSSLSLSPIKQTQENSIGGNNNNNNSSNIGNLSTNKSNRCSNASHVKAYNKNAEKSVDNEQYKNNISNSNSLNNTNKSNNDNNNNVERSIIDKIPSRTTDRDEQVEHFRDIDEAELEQFLSEVDNLNFCPEDNISSSNDTEISTKKPWRNSKSFLLPRMSSGSFGNNPSFVKNLNNQLPVKCNQKKSFVNKKSLGLKSKNHQERKTNEIIDHPNNINGLNTNCNDDVDDDVTDQEIELDSVSDYLSFVLNRDDVSLCVVDEDENCDEVENIQEPTKKYTKQKRNISVNNRYTRKDAVDNLINNDNNEKNSSNLLPTIQASTSNDRNDTEDVNKKLRSKDNNSTVVDKKLTSNQGKNAVDGDIQEDNCSDNITQSTNDKAQNNDKTNKKTRKISKKNTKINKKQTDSQYTAEPSCIHENNKEETTQDGIRRSTRTRKPAPFIGVVIYTTSKSVVKDFGPSSNQQMVNSTKRSTISKKRKISVKDSERTASSKKRKSSKNTKNKVAEFVEPLSPISETINHDEGYSTNNLITSSASNKNHANLTPLIKAKGSCKEIHINDSCGCIEVPPCAKKCKLLINHHRLDLFIVYGKGEISVGGIVREFKESERFTVEKGQNLYVTNRSDNNDRVLIHYYRSQL